MKKERNELKAGLFMLVSVGLIIGVIIGIKGATRFLQPIQRHQVRFKFSDDIGGLAEGDDVRLGGAKVGTIRELDIRESGDNPGIFITIAIPQRYQLHQDASVKVQSTVTGVSVLNIESLGTGAAPLLAEGQVIEG